MITRFIRTLLVVALTLTFHSTIKAQLGERKSEEIGDTSFHYQEYFEIDIKPARIDNESRQLRYSPQVEKLEPGNAAIHYYRACLQYYRQTSELRQKNGQNRDRWFNSPIADFPVKEVQTYLTENDDLLQELQRGLRCNECDWSGSLATTKLDEAIRYDLSEFHLLRTMSRLLRLQARVAIANHDYLSAGNSIANGLKLSADVGKFPSEVAGLVAESIAAESLKSAIEIVSIPGSPNQLSALRSLPIPIVDFFRNIESDIEGIETSAAILQSPETTQRTNDEWQQLFTETVGQLDVLNSYINNLNGSDVQDRATSLSARTTLILAELYPLAKRELLDAGWDPKQVSEMPVGQVVAIQTKRVWDEIRKDLIDARNLPTPEAVALMNSRSNELRDNGYCITSARGDFPIPELLTNIIWTSCFVDFSAARDINRRIAILQNIEQVRDWIAKTGKLPTGDQFTELAARKDPKTGLAFDYERQTETVAILQTTPWTFATDPKFVTVSIRFVIRLKP